MYNVHYTLYIVHYTMYIVQCIQDYIWYYCLLYAIHLGITQYPWLHQTTPIMYNIHYIVNTEHCIVKSGHYIVNTVQCTVYTA